MPLPSRPGADPVTATMRSAASGAPAAIRGASDAIDEGLRDRLVQAAEAAG